MASGTVTCAKDVMAGTPVFRGTRVPIQVLMDHLEAGDRVDVFLEGFPSVTREQVIDVLEEAKNRTIAADFVYPGFGPVNRMHGLMREGRATCSLLYL